MIDWVNWDSYEVYTIPNLDPLLGPRIKRINPFDRAASPNGWLDQSQGMGIFTTTVGNNVYAQLNPAVRHPTIFIHSYLTTIYQNLRSFTYNFRPDGNRDRVFDYPIDFFAEPYRYKEGTVANLFYWYATTKSLTFPN